MFIIKNIDINVYFEFSFFKLDVFVDEFYKGFRI